MKCQIFLLHHKKQQKAIYTNMCSADPTETLTTFRKSLNASSNFFLIFFYHSTSSKLSIHQVTLLCQVPRSSLHLNKKKKNQSRTHLQYTQMDQTIFSIFCSPEMRLMYSSLSSMFPCFHSFCTTSTFPISLSLSRLHAWQDLSITQLAPRRGPPTQTPEAKYLPENALSFSP